jgi:hypothetical protein
MHVDDVAGNGPGRCWVCRVVGCHLMQQARVEMCVDDAAGRGGATSATPCLEGQVAALGQAARQGLTIVHVRAQLEQLQDTFMSQVGLHGGQKSSS